MCNIGAEHLNIYRKRSTKSIHKVRSTAIFIGKDCQVSEMVLISIHSRISVVFSEFQYFGAMHLCHIFDGMPFFYKYYRRDAAISI
jgi:hypothetical protein